MPAPRFQRPHFAGIVFATIIVVSARAAGAPKPPAPLAYDTSAYELASLYPNDPAPWDRAALDGELRERTARQKARRELDVYYYRIGHTIAFPLVIDHRPALTDLPPGIATMKYPWLIWLSWEQEERWRILQAAWRRHDDREAGRLLQRELAALSTWQSFAEMNDVPGLACAHIASCLALALADERGWDARLLNDARRAAGQLLDRDIAPWYARQWANDKPFTPQRLVNIPVITLARAAQLAQVVRDPRAQTMDAKMIEILRAWVRFRLGPEFHSEGTTYDGYLMDSLTGWLAARPESTTLRDECREAFRSLADQWIQLALPGRADLHAPIGDVEPEMTFWTAALGRLAAWHDFGDARWVLTRVPLSRLPAATLIDALEARSVLDIAPTPPLAEAREHRHAVSLRTGWTANDVAAFVSVSRNGMGHLQADGGQVVMGWQGRFWLTDPGYQQYRPGEERDYTIGVEAHNAPVINGAAQKPHATKLVTVERDRHGFQHTRLDLAACYAGLPKNAQVRRDVWLASRASGAVVVRDRFAALAANAEIRTHWLGGHHLAWAFVDGWARLSDGERAVWIGTPDEKLAAAALTRHPGTRGPLTLAHKTQLPEGRGERWWIFWCDPQAGWAPPRGEVNGGNLSVAMAGETAGRATLVFGD